MSSEYDLVMLQVSNDGATVLGNGIRLHNFWSISRSLSDPSRLPKGIFMLLALNITQLMACGI